MSTSALARVCTCRVRADRAASRCGYAADSGPFELITARRLLESECAALAAKNASPAQIRRMRAALAAMIRDRKRNVMPLENDRRFHLEMAEAAGNSALALAGSDAVGPAHRPAVSATRASLRYARSMGRGDCRASIGDGRDRSARRSEGAYDDAPAHGPGCETIPEKLDYRQLAPKDSVKTARSRQWRSLKHPRRDASTSMC